jgi:hypothetical protein
MSAEFTVMTREQQIRYFGHVVTGRRCFTFKCESTDTQAVRLADGNCGLYCPPHAEYAARVNARKLARRIERERES